MSRITEKFLTTQQLARMWAVSEATIKRWADAGLLDFTRTVGGHRRFAPEAAARFERERGLGRKSAALRATTVFAAKGAAVAPAAPPRTVQTPWTKTADEFFDAIIAGQEGKSSAVILKSFLDGGAVADILDEAVAPALRRVGSLWHGGELSVADEHFATRTAVRALDSFNSSVRRRHASGRVAICCAAEGELHEVPVLCLQVLLESEAWRVRSLGGNTPFFALADAVEKYRPELVCVSSTVRAELERSAREFPQLLAAAEGCGALLVLGGEGFRNEGLRRRFPADLHADSFRELDEFLRGSG